MTYLFGAAAGAGELAGAAGAVAVGATVVTAGGVANNFFAFVQSCTTPHVHGNPTNSHAAATSTTGVFFTWSIKFAPFRDSHAL